MIGYIYITVNKINGKKYIGKKKSNKFLDNKYLGSGVLLQQAIKKYGRQNFTVHLIEACNDMDELILREMYWIKFYNAVESKMFYNLSYGNEGHAGRGTYKHSQQCKDKISKSNKGKIRTLENKIKISKSLKQKHNVWVNNTVIEKLIQCKELDTYILNGFKQGRLPVKKSQLIKQIKTHKETIGKLTPQQRKDKFGHKRGVTSDEVKNKISKSLLGRNNWSRNKVWVHTKTEKHSINKDDLQVYLDKGYHLGMYTNKCTICSSTTIENR